MIPALIEASLLSLINVTVAGELLGLRTHYRFERKPKLNPRSESPRLTLIRHRPPEAEPCNGLSEHPMTLLEELRARILAKTGSETCPGPIEEHMAAAISAETDEPSLSAMDTLHDPPAVEPDPSTSERR